MPPVRRVFLFAPSSPPVPVADVARVLRSSLAALLPAFHPFAGELVYDQESGAVAIVCGEGAGVTFVEAETELDMARLVEEGAEHDVDALHQLVPDIRRQELPAPVMAAQVTEFIGGSGSGGIAIGVALHHSAADGRGLWRFLETWASAAAAGFKGVPVAGETPLPLHDRRVTRFDGDVELAGLFLRQIAPDLPRTIPKEVDSSGLHTQLSRRTFTVRASAVRSLKQHLASKGTEPSTFAAVSAHGWVSIARASGFNDGAPVFAVFLADLRALMSPPVPDSYVGNCLAVCTVSLTGAELAAPDGCSRACLAIREAVAQVRRDPLGDRRRWVTKFTDIPRGRGIIMAGSPWFSAYAVDFGFGKPVMAELASMNHDGEMVLVAGSEVGSVQASVALAADKMPAFHDLFLS